MNKRKRILIVIVSIIFTLGMGKCGKHQIPNDEPVPAASPTPDVGKCNAPCTFNEKTGEMKCPC